MSSIVKGERIGKTARMRLKSLVVDLTKKFANPYPVTYKHTDEDKVMEESNLSHKFSITPSV